MPQNKTRKYTTSDAYMLSTAGTLRLLFLEDLAAFTAFDSTLDAAFAATWQAKIEAAQNTLPHSLIKDILAGKTEIVVAIMEDAKDCYRELRFFSQKVFKDSIAKQNEFGVADYPKARVSQEAMIALLGELHSASVKYAAPLIAGGFTQQKIDAIDTLRQALDTANLEQESYKTGSRSLTQDRKGTLNECYAITKLVIDAAMVIFDKNPARRSAYLYNKGSGKRQKKKVVVESGEEE